MRRLSTLQETIGMWRDIESRARTLSEFVDLSMQDGDYSIQSWIESETGALTKQISQEEFQLILSDEYDERDAIVAVHAGAGGTDSQDWAEMLVRMYTRWAERRRATPRIIDVSPGDEAGIKSAIIEISGRYAYGYLKAERGVHRLVRLSPFDSVHLRHTSFALVEVLPEANQDMDIPIGPDDLRIDVFRSSGPGGQHAQKSATAVRITHIPTGTVTTCQNERSQLQNKETALRIMRARLIEIELQRRATEQAKLKGEHISPEWGNQIRSYILHPYKMVRDHRTGCETSNTEAVLDGALDEFINAYLLSAIGRA